MKVSILDTFFQRNVLAVFTLIVGIIITMYGSYNYYSPQENKPVQQKDDCYTFLTEWYDNMAGIRRKLRLIYYTKDKTIEIYDLEARKIFLKRNHIKGVNEKEFYLGNTIVVLSRPLKILDYADEATRLEITRKREKTFAMIKPDAINEVGEIVDFIERNGFEITRMKMIRMSEEKAQEFYQEHSNREFFQALINYIKSGPVVAMELIGEDSVSRWRRSLGPTDSVVARSQVPESLRAKFGTDKQKNAVHGSDSVSSAERELELLFGNHRKSRDKMEEAPSENGSRTCCIIKPHSISEENLGKILTYITKHGFRIKELEMFRLQKPQAEEFLEIYKEVVPEYPRMVQQLISGPLVALELEGTKDFTPEDFRQFVGPTDPEIAKELRPSSARAVFGVDKVRNALHCTDLAEDAPLEIGYFFKLLRD